MSFVKQIEEFDAKYGIPRPADAEHLPPFHAFLRLTRHVSMMFVVLCCGCLSSYLLWKCAGYLRVSAQTWLYFYMGIMVCGGVALMEAIHEVIPYYRLRQRLTYGTGRWADERYLSTTNLAIKVGDNLEGLPRGAVRIGKLRRGYDLVLPETEWLRHVALFGPPGSGKSATFLMGMLRDIARGGSAIILDPKGELYEQTAGAFRQVYRLDLLNPSRSDRWNFVPACKGDQEFANQMAATMIGLEGTKQSVADPFWQESELLLLTAVLLHISDVVDNPTPPMVYEYLGTRDMKTIGAEMTNTTNPAVRLSWGAFDKAPPQTQGSVITGLMNKLAPFQIKNAQAVCAPITEADRLAGVRQIDFRKLRTRGTAIYVVVAEGDASRYKNVLSTFFGQAVNQLRIDRPQDDPAPVTFCLDEAANVPLVGLKEFAGVGRGRKIGLLLGYQNLPQVQDQYNHDGANAILGSIGTMIFLPGLDDATTQYASRRIGQTTVWSHTTIDARGKKADSERQSETGRALMDPTELRQMVKHSQCVVVIDCSPPIKSSFPPFGVRKEKALAPDYGQPRLVSLLEAEEEKLETAARAFRQQELATAMARINSGVVGDSPLVNSGELMTGLRDVSDGNTFTIADDSLYQAVFSRLVEGKLPEPVGVEFQTPFAKLVKSFFDTGRITKWEDVRDLDRRVMQRVGLRERVVVPLPEVSESGQSVVVAEAPARVVVPAPPPPASRPAAELSVARPVAVAPVVPVVPSAVGVATVANQAGERVVSGKPDQRTFLFFSDQTVKQELDNTASVVITTRARAGQGGRPEVTPVKSYRSGSPPSVVADSALVNSGVSTAQDMVR